MDIPFKTNNYNPLTGAGSVGVEFVCTSVTSSSSTVPLDPIYNLIEILLPHIKYVDLHKKGFGILDLTETQAQGDFYSVNTIEVPDTNYRYETGYYTLPGTRWLKKATRPTEQDGPKQYYAPFTPRTSIVTGIRNNPGNMVLVSAYPNPFIDKIYLQYNIFQSSPVSFEIYDMSGKLVKQFNKGSQGKGLHVEEIDLGDIARGQYKLVVRNQEEWMERSIMKF
jgi:alkaline phosphatase D